MTRFPSSLSGLGLTSVGLASLMLAGCPDNNTMTEDTGGTDAGMTDTSGLDAPGADVPGTDTGVDGGGPLECLTGYPTLNAEAFASGLTAPTYLTGAPGSPDLFVVEKGGTIRVLDTTGASVGTFLDISANVRDSGEQGLLGLAFHPGYADNGLFYVYYTENGSQDNVVAVGTRASARAANPTVQVILRMDDFASNHNGGCLQFGPDGELYIGTGDGGGGGDPMANGQDIDQLLGKLLRIHVDATTGTSYTIPATNPFAGATAGADEIYAYGLRNPWRFSFDRTTGDLYIGDVGQDLWEEIDVVNAGEGAGLNFGWSECEGFENYDSAGTCSIDQHDPIVVARHGGDTVLGSGIASITGGYVYRGTAIAGLAGTYLFGDYGNGAVGGFRYCEGTLQEYQEIDDLSGLCNGLSSFGQDNAGELYMICINNGTIRRIVGG